MLLPLLLASVAWLHEPRSAVGHGSRGHFAASAHASPGLLGRHAASRYHSTTTAATAVAVVVVLDLDAAAQPTLLQAFAAGAALARERRQRVHASALLAESDQPALGVDQGVGLEALDCGRGGQGGTSGVGGWVGGETVPGRERGGGGGRVGQDRAGRLTAYLLQLEEPPQMGELCLAAWYLRGEQMNRNT